MGKQQLRLLICAGTALAMIVASVLVLDWFTAKLGIKGGMLDRVSLDLRNVRGCTADNICGSVPLDKLPVQGSFFTFAPITFWTSLGFGALLLFQAGTRLLGSTVSEQLTRIGYGLGTLVMFNALGAGYLFSPDGFKGTWAPALLLGGGVLGVIAFALASSEEIDDDADTYKPVKIPPKAPTATPPPAMPRGKTPTAQTVIDRPNAPPPSRPRVPDEVPFTPDPDLGLDTAAMSSPTIALGAQTVSVSGSDVLGNGDTLDGDTAALLGAEATLGGDSMARTVMRPSGDRPSTDAPFVSEAPSAVTRVAAAITQEQLRKKLAYATASATFEEAGLNARREDGLVKLVRWRDIVGVVVRRLPAATPYEGLTIVDIVSAPGATLRILPWTKLLGASLEIVGDLRARALIGVIKQRCPELHIDKATQAFLAGELPAQLPDEATLGIHDKRLA